MDTIQFDHKRFGDIIKTIKSCYEKSHERIFDKNLFVDLWNIINDLLNLIEIHQTNLTDEDFEMIENECYLLIKFKNPDSDDEINIDLDSAKSLFYKFFNFFNRDFIQNDLKDISMPNDHLTNISCFLTNRISWSNLHLHYIICLEMHSDDEDRPTNFLELLSLILNKIKKLARCPDLNDTQQDTLKHFSYMIFNHTNATNSIPQFIQSQFAQQIIDLLKIIIEYKEQTLILIHSFDILCIFNFRQENRYLFFEKSILNTIFNISRHDQGIEWLNQFNTTELILKFPNTHQDTNVTTTCSMILALLSTPEQIKHQKYLTDVFDHLLQHTFHASVDKRFMSESYHISEILLVFVKLFNDDRTANYILEQSNVDLQTSSTTEFFIEFFIRYYSLENNHDPLRQTTITALVNIFWSISFQDKYKQILQQAKPQFKQFIENLSKQTNENSSTNEYIPHFLENIPKAAACILTNLNDSSKYLSKSESSKKTRSQPKIMISYSHEDQQICKQLHEIMIDQGFQTWVDFECLKGGDDLWEEIAIGMMDADVIFCLISDQYCKSKSCRQEAVYALEKLKEKKLILPIYLQQPQLPPWLGKMFLKKINKIFRFYLSIRNSNE